MLKAFLSYRYRPDGDALADKIKALLGAIGVVVVDGKQVVAGEPLNQQIEERIRECDFLVLLRNDGDPGNFLYQETGYARGAAKHVVVVSENTPAGGLVDSDYQILISRGEMEAAADLARAVRAVRRSIASPRSLNGEWRGEASDIEVPDHLSYQQPLKYEIVCQFVQTGRRVRGTVTTQNDRTTQLTFRGDMVGDYLRGTYTNNDPNTSHWGSLLGRLDREGKTLDGYYLAIQLREEGTVFGRVTMRRAERIGGSFRRPG